MSPIGPILEAITPRHPDDNQRDSFFHNSKENAYIANV